MRLRLVYLKILRRLEGVWSNMASELDSRLCKLIRNWGQPQPAYVVGGDPLG